MNWANLLYICCQFTPNNGICHILCIICFFLFITSMILKNNLNKSRLFFFFICIIILSLLLVTQLLSYDYFDLNTSIISALFYTSITFTFLNYKAKISLKIIKIFTLINFLFLFSFFIPYISDLFWREHIGNFRYRSYFSEPSVSSIVYLINILILFAVYKNLNIFIVLNSICIIFTFSMFGYFALFLLFSYYFVFFRRFYFKFSILALIILIFLYLNVNAYNLVFLRLNAIINGLDLSSNIRLLNPFHALYVLLSKFDNLYLGVGIGNVDSFFFKYKSSFPFFYDWSNDYNPYINNSLVNIIIHFGVFTTILYISILLSFFLKAKNYLFLFFFLLYVFGSGYIFNPLFVLLVLICSDKNFYRCTQFLKRT